jgi:hypothetical protein
MVDPSWGPSTLVGKVFDAQAAIGDDAGSRSMNGDRRKPIARYVLFADEEAQGRFAVVAEAAYRDIARLAGWSGRVTVALSDPQRVVTRRGLLRRAVAEETPGESIVVTGALAAAGEVGRDEPARVEALGGCTAEGRLAGTMGRVVGELVRDLGRVPVDEQRAHPAYRQTLRLAAELQGLRTMLAETGCADPVGCVRLRQAEHWGRREEDVEVDEVRAVLRELAADPEG